MSFKGIKFNQIREAIADTEGVGIRIVSSDPDAVSERGQLYSKLVDGYAELFYQDDDGNAVQVTTGGVINAEGASGGGEGDFIKLTDGQPVSNIDINTSDVQVIPESGSGLAFTTLNSSEYSVRLGFQCAASSSAATVEFYLVFDEGESNEQTITPGTTWRVRGVAGSYSNVFLEHSVTLTAGDHTVKVYGSAVTGTTFRIVGSSVTTNTAPFLTLAAIVGGGVPEIVDGYLILPNQLVDPEAAEDYGVTYVKSVDGYSELHYLDDYGNSTQITNKGSAVGGGGGGSLYIDTFTAAGGDEDFTLSETPDTNTNTPSGYSILSVTVNGVGLAYDATPADEFEFGYTEVDGIVTKDLADGDLVEVRYFV